MKSNRREFLQSMLGGALVIGSPIMGGVQTFAQGTDKAFKPSLWLAIETSGQVTIMAHRSEMGTGIRTCLPAVLADELDADLEQVTIQQALGDEAYGSQNTDGSRSIRDFFQTMREVGANARFLLETAAAKTWAVPVKECVATNHKVTHKKSGRSLSFGQLVPTASQLKVPAKGKAPLKDRSQWRYIGKDFKTYDSQDIIKGTATFGADVRIPGMKYAAVARCPVLGGQLKSHDATETLKVPGVKQVLIIPAFKAPHAFQALGGVAVIATSSWAAFEGRRRLKIQWKDGPNANYDSKTFRSTLLDSVRKPGKPIRKEGDATTAIAKASKKHHAEYVTPLLAHATMEAPCATARFTNDSCEVWAPNQNPQAARDAVVASLGLKKKQVTIHTTLLGGGFGRKSKPDFIVEAALLSKASNETIQVVWSREDDIRHDYYHAPAAIRCEAGINEKNQIQGFLMRVAFSSIMSTFVAGLKNPADIELMMGVSDLPYQVKDLQAESCPAPAHIRIGWLRSVCNIFHVFATSSFIDELANIAKEDSARFILQSLGEARKIQLSKDVKYPNYGRSLEDFPIDIGRLRNVIETAQTKAWNRKVPQGHGLGIAAHRSFQAYVAVVVEAKVSPDAQVSVPRVDLVIDCGTVVNPDRVRAQMEGSIIFGLSLALLGEISVKNGRVIQSNFHDYPVQRIYEAPKIMNITLVSSDKAPGGAGEPGVPPIAPALANAIFAACGQRLRELPLRPKAWK